MMAVGSALRYILILSPHQNWNHNPEIPVTSRYTSGETNIRARRLALSSLAGLELRDAQGGVQQVRRLKWFSSRARV